jgi:hypothetical protein
MKKIQIAKDNKVSEMGGESHKWKVVWREAKKGRCREATKRNLPPLNSKIQ